MNQLITLIFNLKTLLKKALLNYDGSLIVVSHDREFLQGLSQNHMSLRIKKLENI